MTFNLILRSIILYIIILFLFRIMGKRQIGEMQPFELVMTLTLADLATIPMSETSKPIIQGIIPVLTLTCIHYLICLLSRKSLFFRKLFNGKPLILLDNNGINFENLKKANMNFNDLLEGIHTAGYFNLEELLYVILQTNGSLTIVNRSAFTPLTSNDIKLKKEEATLPIIIISKGKFINENIKLTKQNKEYFLNILNKNNYKNLKDILIMTIDNNGKIYIQEKNKKYKNFNIKYNKGDNW